MADHNLLNCVRKIKGLFIFAGDIVPTDEPAYKGISWRSGRGLEADKTGPVFSYERVLAAAALWRMNNSLILVPSGGDTNVDGVGKSPPVASVIAAELQMLGVPPYSIAEETKAYNTWQQLIYCSGITHESGWYMDDCAILAPVWQMGRIHAMVERGLAGGAYIEPFEVGITLISMERALAAEDEKWNAYFKEKYAAPEFQMTLASEAMGTGQLLTGHQPRWPHPFRGFDDPLAI